MADALCEHCNGSSEASSLLGSVSIRKVQSTFHYFEPAVLEMTQRNLLLVCASDVAHHMAGKIIMSILLFGSNQNEDVIPVDWMRSFFLDNRLPQRYVPRGERGFPLFNPDTDIHFQNLVSPIHPPLMWHWRTFAFS